MKPDPNEQYDEEQASRIAYLVAGYLRQTLSEKEHDELDDWMTASDENQRLFEELTDPKTIEKGLKEYDAPDTEVALKKIKKKLEFTTPPPEKQRKKARIIRYGIAASILLLAGAMLFQMKFKTDKPEITKTNLPDIQAGGNRATLTVANGYQIDLANAKNGLLDSSGGSDVLKSAEGQLSYESSKNEGKGYHILTTPAGGQYSVTLPDGTRVWLNAASSLKYPLVFDPEERVVELTGEGYFEVAKEKAAGITEMELGRRFIVKLKNDASVEVLGTHFNINSYEDEQFIQTTLLEGSVSVKSATMGATISPGDQSTIVQHGFIETKKGIDTSGVIAWKYGKFQFRDATIETIMRQVARWYDAEIVYESKPAFHLNATIYRNEPVSKLLELLEATERVQFKIEGRRIVVSGEL